MKKKTSKKHLTYWLSVAVVGIALGLGLQFVRAWTEPTQAPPNGNVGAPINTSTNPQTKAGDLTSNGKITASQFCLSSDSGDKCISVWPDGVSSDPTSVYKCPYSACSLDCGMNCDGEIHTGATCTDVPCERTGWNPSDIWCDFRNAVTANCKSV